MTIVAVHELLSLRSRDDWHAQWRQSDGICADYGLYCRTLASYIRSLNPQRIFLIHEDRRFFLAGLLASIHVGVDIVIPSSSAPGLIEDLMQPGDVALKDILSLKDYAPYDCINLKLPTITFFTSGSTGSPKAIVKSCHQLTTEIALLDSLWEFNKERPTVYSTVPHHHIYGLVFSLLWPACAGYRLTSHTYPFWEEMLEKSTSSDWLISSPAHLSRLPIFQGNVFSKIFSAASPLSYEDSCQTQGRFGCLPLEILGSTETGAIAYRHQNKREEPWLPLPKIEISVDDNQRMRVRSPYISDPDGYQTEDRIDLMSTQQFHLRGRADRIVKIEGKRICLIELEHRLKSLPHLRDAVTLLLTESSRDEIGVITTLSSEGKCLLSQIGKLEFVRRIRQNLSHFLDPIVLPRRWRFVEHIPTDNRGKRPPSLLKELFHDAG